MKKAKYVGFGDKACPSGGIETGKQPANVVPDCLAAYLKASSDLLIRKP